LAGVSAGFGVKLELDQDYSLSNVDLSITPSTTYAFLPTTFTYFLNVPFSSQTITFKPTVNDALSVVSTRLWNSALNAQFPAIPSTAQWTPVASGAVSTSYFLNLGQQRFDVMVVSSDALSFVYYTYYITRQNNVATVSSLSTNIPGSFLGFSPSNVGPYNIQTFDSATGLFTLTATLTDPNSQLLVGNLGNINRASSGQSMTIWVPTGGPNEVDVQVVSEDKSVTSVYRLLITRQTNNADLSSIALFTTTGPLALSVAFNSSLTTYTAVLPASIAQVGLIATTSDPAAGLAYSGTYTGGFSSAANNGLSGVGYAIDIPVSQALTTVNARVTATNGLQKTYTVTLTRPTANVLLSSLAIGTNAFTPGFQSNVYQYTSNIATTVASTTVTLTKQDPAASVSYRVGGNAFVAVPTSNSFVAVLPGFGQTQVDIMVSASNGQTTQLYTILVVQTSANSFLKSLVTGPQNVVGFTPSILTYGVVQPSGAATATIVAVPQDPTSQLAYGIGPIATTPFASGNSVSVNLAFGLTTVTIRVTAADQSQRTYTLSITRVQYQWVYGTYSQCSSACGGGVSGRSVTCQDQNGQIYADQSICTAALGAAVLQQTCNSALCNTFAYAAVAQGGCSCSTNTQSFNVFCYNTNDATQTAVDAVNCQRLNLAVPPSSVPCASNTATCFQWSQSAYTTICPRNGSCPYKPYFISRGVFCTQSNTIVDPSNCASQTMPDTQLQCQCN
jgi:hypothetical protein